MTKNNTAQPENKLPSSSRGSAIEQTKESHYLALRKTQTPMRSDRPDWQTRILRGINELSRSDQGKMRLSSTICYRLSVSL
ncbi:MAG: hypothetical protein GY784_01285 [Gammaproteobacteria bacterium]|nr:hypothetical protein [Gammaproteobacteria bacterium]